MNTKLLMATSAIILGVSGIGLAFAPELALNSLSIEPTPAELVLGQVIGGLYFGFAMLNWMAQGSPIGGIYNRPILVANLSHFLIAGLSIVRLLLAGLVRSPLLWAAGGVYILLAVLFGLLMYRHPFPPAG